MQHAIPDLLRPSLVPELATNVAAGPAGHVHLRLVHVAALRTAPFEFAVLIHDLNLAIPAALLAVVAFGIQLGIDDVVVDELHQPQHRSKVVLHIGNLDVADSSTRGERLELRFKPELLKGVDLLRHMDVVAVGDVTLIGDTGNDAKPPLKRLGELILAFLLLFIFFY